MDKTIFKVTVEPHVEVENNSTPDSPSRTVRLPNPPIPVREYNLATQYCYRFDNMTRQDWVEIAIIEKLHNDGQMPDEEFNARYQEIKNRPPRGQRKGTKQNNHLSK